MPLPGASRIQTGRLYMRGLRKHWEAAMLGIASLILGAIGAFFGDRAYLLALCAFGLVSLLIAGYLTWRDADLQRLAEPFTLLIQGSECIYRSARVLIHTGPSLVFYPFSNSTEDCSRLRTQLDQHMQQVTSVFKSRQLVYSGSLNKWRDSSTQNLSHAQLLIALEDHKEELMQTKQKILLGRVLNKR